MTCFNIGGSPKRLEMSGSLPDVRSTSMKYPFRDWCMPAFYGRNVPLRSSKGLMQQR